MPFELNSPWSNSWKFFMLRGISTEVACVHAAPIDGACAQTRITISVVGVEVATGLEVLELLPQLGSSVIISMTYPSTGTIISSLLCHIEHPAMPWRLRRCQGARAKIERIETEAERRRLVGWPLRRTACWSKRTAGIEGGGRLPDARLFMTRLCGGHHSVAGRSSQPKRGTLNAVIRTALKIFDDG